MEFRSIVLAGLVLCAACADDSAGDVSCAAFATTAVIVEIAGGQPSSAIVTARRDGSTWQCYGYPARGSDEDAGEGAQFFCTERGSSRSSESYTIDVHAGDNRWSKSVHVQGDECHVTKPEVVTIDLATKPVGRALLADCADGTGANNCCKDVPQHGACDAEGLYCHSPCKFPSDDADRGKRLQWSCSGGRWRGGNAEDECTKQGARKPGT